ncbi:MAG: hypothetical protein AAF921_23100 [Cyanobacteria bacterium P01_D01_bin.44]
MPRCFMRAIALQTRPTGQTLNPAAVITLHLLDQSPGAVCVSGVTLYFVDPSEFPRP